MRYLADFEHYADKIVVVILANPNKDVNGVTAGSQVPLEQQEVRSIDEGRKWLESRKHAYPGLWIPN